MEFTVPHTVDAVRDTVLSSCAGSPLYLDRDGGHELENLSESEEGSARDSVKQREERLCRLSTSEILSMTRPILSQLADEASVDRSRTIQPILQRNPDTTAAMALKLCETMVPRGGLERICGQEVERRHSMARKLLESLKCLVPTPPSVATTATTGDDDGTAEPTITVLSTIEQSSGAEICLRAMILLAFATRANELLHTRDGDDASRARTERNRRLLAQQILETSQLVHDLLSPLCHREASCLQPGLRCSLVKLLEDFTVQQVEIFHGSTPCPKRYCRGDSLQHSPEWSALCSIVTAGGFSEPANVALQQLASILERNDTTGQRCRTWFIKCVSTESGPSWLQLTLRLSRVTLSSLLVAVESAHRPSSGQLAALAGLIDAVPGISIAILAEAVPLRHAGALWATKCWIKLVASGMRAAPRCELIRELRRIALDSSIEASVRVAASEAILEFTKTCAAAPNNSMLQAVVVELVRTIVAVAGCDRHTVAARGIHCASTILTGSIELPHSEAETMMSGFRDSACTILIHEAAKKRPSTVVLNSVTAVLISLPAGAVIAAAPRLLQAILVSQQRRTKDAPNSSECKADKLAAEGSLIAGEVMKVFAQSLYKASRSDSITSTASSRASVQHLVRLVRAHQSTPKCLVVFKDVILSIVEEALKLSSLASAGALIDEIRQLVRSACRAVYDGSCRDVSADTRHSIVLKYSADAESLMAVVTALINTATDEVWNTDTCGELETVVRTRIDLTDFRYDESGSRQADVALLSLLQACQGGSSASLRRWSSRLLSSSLESVLAAFPLSAESVLSLLFAETDLDVVIDRTVDLIAKCRMMDGQQVAIVVRALGELSVRIGERITSVVTEAIGTGATDQSETLTSVLSRADCEQVDAAVLRATTDCVQTGSLADTVSMLRTIVAEAIQLPQIRAASMLSVGILMTMCPPLAVELAPALESVMKDPACSVAERLAATVALVEALPMVPSTECDNPPIESLALSDDDPDKVSVDLSETLRFMLHADPDVQIRSAALATLGHLIYNKHLRRSHTYVIATCLCDEAVAVRTLAAAVLDLIVNDASAVSEAVFPLLDTDGSDQVVESLVRHLVRRRDIDLGMVAEALLSEFESNPRRSTAYALSVFPPNQATSERVAHLLRSKLGTVSAEISRLLRRHQRA